jgi:hypothetical protein
LTNLRASGKLLDTILMSSSERSSSENGNNGNHVHRILLASLSDKMEKLVIRELNQSRSTSNSTHLTIHFNYSYECITELVYFIYKHKLSNLVDIITCCELLELSIKFDIFELGKLCEKWLIENLCFDAIKLIYETKLANDRPKLKQFAFNWLTTHSNNLNDNADICKILIYFAKH